MVQLNVPLLTIVPIPYIAIHDIDINFKANISASSSSVSEQSSSSALDVGAEASIGAKWGSFHMDAKMKANYSSKKDSKATQESKYSVEYTMDVAVKAGQDRICQQVLPRFLNFLVIHLIFLTQMELWRLHARELTLTGW